MSAAHNSHVFVLHADTEAAEIRHAVHLCEREEARIESVMAFLKDSGRPQLSSAHIAALADGPKHAHFAQALAALDLTTSSGCPTPIVERAIEMMIASDMLPVAVDGDAALHESLHCSFSTDEDWDNFSESAQHAIVSYLLHYEMLTSQYREQLTGQEQQLVVQLASALIVAIIQARAEYQRVLTSERS